MDANYTVLSSKSCVRVYVFCLFVFFHGKADFIIPYEPPRGKTNKVVSEQV